MTITRWRSSPQEAADGLRADGAPDCMIAFQRPVWRSGGTSATKNLTEVVRESTNDIGRVNRETSRQLSRSMGSGGPSG